MRRERRCVVVEKPGTSSEFETLPTAPTHRGTCTGEIGNPAVWSTSRGKQERKRGVMIFVRRTASARPVLS